MRDQLRMTRLAAFFLGLLLGGTVATLGFLLREALPTKVYTVQSISHHYPYETANSQTQLVVYRQGDTGHVMEVNCAFPPASASLTMLMRKSFGNW